MTDATKTPAEIAASLRPHEAKALVEAHRYEKAFARLEGRAEHVCWFANVVTKPGHNGLQRKRLVRRSGSFAVVTDLGRAVAAELTK